MEYRRSNRPRFSSAATVALAATTMAKTLAKLASMVDVSSWMVRGRREGCSRAYTRLNRPFPTRVNHARSVLVLLSNCAILSLTATLDSRRTDRWNCHRKVDRLHAPQSGRRAPRRRRRPRARRCPPRHSRARRHRAHLRLWSASPGWLARPRGPRRTCIR